MLAGIATIVDLGLLFFLTEFVKIWYFYSAMISYFAGMITNYSLNKYLNFKNKSKRVALQFTMFMFVALIGLALNQIILLVLVGRWGLWYIFAKAISIFVVMFWSFFGHRKITFNILQ
ncbi:MAG: GtrA family protein [Nanoarchaeota archaeon]|nr:GtrA family protein [Nanoarchaeota archaeon]MBU0977078.1 GtrA family protein [Nanoarchaeota archaeon]